MFTYDIQNSLITHFKESSGSNQEYNNKNISFAKLKWNSKFFLLLICVNYNTNDSWVKRIIRFLERGWLFNKKRTWTIVWEKKGFEVRPTSKELTKMARFKLKVSAVNNLLFWAHASLSLVRAYKIKKAYENMCSAVDRQSPEVWQTSKELTKRPRSKLKVSATNSNSLLFWARLLYVTETCLISWIVAQ